MMNQQVQPVKVQSKLGLASFLIAIVTFIFVIALFIMAMSFDSRRSQVGESLTNFWLVSFFILAPLAHLVGTILGVIVLFQKQRKKVFAVLGIILNIAFVALGLSVVILLLRVGVAWH
jgi:hypothetical protein